LIREEEKKGSQGGSEGRSTSSRDVPVYFGVDAVDAVAGFCLLVAGRD